MSGCKAFFGGGGWGLYMLRVPAAEILYAPLLYPPPLEGYFQGWGGGRGVQSLCACFPVRLVGADPISGEKT